MSLLRKHDDDDGFLFFFKILVDSIRLLLSHSLSLYNAHSSSHTHTKHTTKNWCVQRNVCCNFLRKFVFDVVAISNFFLVSSALTSHSLTLTHSLFSPIATYTLRVWIFVFFFTIFRFILFSSIFGKKTTALLIRPHKHLTSFPFLHNWPFFLFFIFAIARIHLHKICLHIIYLFYLHFVAQIHE